MPITLSAEATFTRELIPADTYVARCVEMIAIGTVESEFNGKKKKQAKIRLTWELPDHLVEYKDKQEPARISEKYTATLDERGNLRQMLISWRGQDFTPEQLKGFDVDVLVGVPCLLSITQDKGKDGKTYNNIASVSKLMKSMTCPPQHHPSRILEYGNFDWDIFDSLPDFLKKQIEATPEFQALTRPANKPAPAQPTAEQKAAAAPAPSDEELPF